MDAPTDTPATAITTATLTREAAEDLGRRLQGLAATQASLDHDFCDLVDQFDAGGALAWFHGIKSVAHYLAWSCSMNDGVAREHVRVARALRELPRVKELFSQGRFSYSKVRELTRLANDVDENALCDLALEMTASQLARTVASFRSAAGTRIRAADKRRLTTQQTPDGMVRITVVLPPDEAALIQAAIEAASRRAETPEAGRDEGSHTGAPLLEDVPAGTFPTIDRVTALLDVASGYLEARPSTPADDHTLVVVHVAAEQLTAQPLSGGHVSGGQEPGDAAAPHLPAGTSESVGIDARVAGSLRSGTCFVEGQGPVEAATAQRLACTGSLVGVVVDAAGEVLALGRTVRLASRAQRRALKVRDKGICQFPGCSTRHHLDAHHVVPWAQGGRTDLDTMLLMCRRHHVFVHEGGVRITRPQGSHRRFHFELPDGVAVTGTWREDLAHDVMQQLLADQATARASEQGATDPVRIFPLHAGAGFSLHECVDVLFRNQRTVAQAA